MAPRWRDDPNRIVWPTRGLPDALASFATEEFIEAVIKDVGRRTKIDERGVALGWSSSGPAVYAAAMQDRSPLRGAFVAMSVFKPDQLPLMEHARGRAFYLLHSPQDFITMRFPEEARDKLTAAGARVELPTCEGGHGWRGDVFGNIRKGIEWLEANMR